MSVSLKRKSLIAFMALAGAWSSQSTAQAADPVVGYYERPAVRVHRERPRVIRTTYVHREVLDCQTLKISEPDETKFVKHCFPPIFDRS
jgi:hypothetical protein